MRVGPGRRSLALAAMLSTLTGCPVVAGFGRAMAEAAMIIMLIGLVVVLSLELTLVLVAALARGPSRIVAACFGIAVGSAHVTGVAYLLGETELIAGELVVLAYCSPLGAACALACLVALIRGGEPEQRKVPVAGSFVLGLAGGVALVAALLSGRDPWAQIPTSPVVEVEVTGGSGCARHRDGVVSCWTGRWPVVVEGFSDARALAVDERGACAIDGQARLWCWAGAPESTHPRATQWARDVQAIAGFVDPGPHDPGLPSVVFVSTGGAVMQVSQGGSPVSIDARLDGAEQAVQRDEDGCALERGGRGVVCWRLPRLGEREQTPLHAELLAVTRSDRCVATRAGGVACTSGTTLTLPTLAEIDGGTLHACARTEAGAVYCWGDNSFGELGIGDREPRSTHRRVKLPEPAVDLGLHDEAACAALESGAVYCWGRVAPSMLEDPARAQTCRRSKLLGDVRCVPTPSRMRWFGPDAVLER